MIVVLEAALAVLSAAVGSSDHHATADTAVQQLHQLFGGYASAMFLAIEAERLDLVAAAGPQASLARQHWNGGLVLLAQPEAVVPLSPLAEGQRLLQETLYARGRIIGLLAVVLSSECAANQPNMLSVGYAANQAVVSSGCTDEQQRLLMKAFATRIAPALEQQLLAAELAASAHVAQRSTHVNDTLHAILAGVRRVVPADAAGVLIREGDHARIIAVHGHPDDAVGHLLPIGGDYTLEIPLLSGEPLKMDDLQAAENNSDTAPGSENIKGYLAAPLRAGDEVVGVLCADSWRSGSFDDEDLRRLCRFADHVGEALTRTRTYAQALAESAALREAAQLAIHDPSAGDIIPGILEGLRRVVACDGASVLLREGDLVRIVAIHGHPESVLGHTFPIIGHAPLEIPLTQGRPFLTADLSGEPTYVPAPNAIVIRGHLSVPLKARGEILGLLAVDSLRRHAFDPDDLHRVELFAGYVAAALLNMRLHSAVRDAAERDPVTRLYNHRAIHDHLDTELARAGDSPLAVAMLDLDGFKKYNDTYGHQVGDVALQAVATALAGACRADDRVGRYGGDEFLMVMPGLGPEEGPALTARLQGAVAEQTLRLAATAAIVPLHVSVGIACYPQDGVRRDALIARADARLYASKQSPLKISPSVQPSEIIA